MKKIIITIDSLRKDFFDEIYANHLNLFEGLNFVLFDNMISCGTWTDPSITSIYTGKMPFEHNILADNANLLSDETIADHYKGLGYETIMVGQGSGYLSTKRNIPRGFNKLVNLFENRFSIKNIYYGWDATISKSFYEAKKQYNENLNRDLFMHIHTWFWNKNYLMPWKMYFSLIKKFGVIRVVKFFIEVFKSNKKGNQFRHFVSAYHRNEIDVDFEVIRKIYHLSALNAINQALDFIRFIIKNMKDEFEIILTSDHGELLGENHMLGHNFYVCEEIVRVPFLIFKSSFSSKSTITKYCSTVNLKNYFTNNLEFDSLSDKEPKFQDGRLGGIKNLMLKINHEFPLSDYDKLVNGTFLDGVFTLKTIT